ncbi:hypothetical protein B4133_2733 [Bacillus altitudinis]|uniref:DUF4241 domain-containing protein n=1 Tax=Bacillus altitudinis TaxID=293387 RepID=UPI000596C6C7|nr:DUF4241 domain-containing protein [Bacillus altitudinis]KIL26158.1 hypothetical protein B4133_2733 [Bacillus altitudinis]
MYNINPTHLLYKNGETTSSQEGDQLFDKHIVHIEITSGHIVACDPFVSEGDQSFSKKVHPRKYPILLMVKRLESGDERVAYAMIKFTNEQAIEWELATRAGQELKHLKEDEFYGYGVNTGMGSFMDAEAALYLQAYEDKRYKEDNDFYLYEEFAEALEQNYKHTWDWLVTRFHDKMDIAMFTTGFGDGMYPSFWGWMKTENLLAL